MAIKPILFNTEMVKAILDGRKTCTRRAVKYKYDNTQMEVKTDKYGSRLIEIQCDVEGETYGKNSDGSTWRRLRPFIEKKSPYRCRDILYVRETWGEGYSEGTYIYKADDKLAEIPTFKESSKRLYHPSIHMPKEAARIWLKVTDVRVERLQDIDGKGCLKEGIEEEPLKYVGDEFVKGMFHDLWDSTIKKSDLDRYGWDANPYVWAIEFERCEKPDQTKLRPTRYKPLSAAQKCGLAASRIRSGNAGKRARK